MSSAIKPPGAPGTTGPNAPTDTSRSPEGAGEAFRDELSKAEVSRADASKPDASRADLSEAQRASATADTRASGATGSARADMLRALADEIRSGRVDPQQAVERLIERALHTGPAASLPPARRAELEALLRAALEEDPTLAAMQRDLTRGR